MNKVKVANKSIDINEQGYLINLNDWSEAYVKRMAKQDGVKLYNDHWEIIFYFREYYHQNLVSPTMHHIYSVQYSEVSYLLISLEYPTNSHPDC